MAGNAKIELSSVSPEDLGFAGSYANGPRGAHPGASLDRFGSFRENNNSRAFSNGVNMSKGKASNLTPLSQCMTLEPFALGDQKYSRSSELKRALGFSFGSFSEDNSLEELKLFRGSIQDSSDKARTRSRVLEDNLNILTTYVRRLQINERSSGPKLLKTGAQSNMKSPDLVTHEVGDRVKNALSKRARTPVADMRVEGRGTGIPRQHLVLGKDRDIAQGSTSSEFVEEEMRRLPAGGESWDRKMKRKRSVSSVFPRTVDSDREIKRAMHGRLTSDSGMPSSDAPAFRVCSNAAAGNTKPDGSPSASGSSGRPTPKSKTEKLSYSRNLAGENKERISPKGNNKLNVRDENHLANPSLIAKGKASRASRIVPPMMADTSPTSHMPSTPEDWELQSNVNKIQNVGGSNSRKGAFSSESSSPPMAQWGGQRPQKVSRIRRTNIVSPAFNNGEVVISSEGCATTDVIASGGFNSMANNMQQIKVRSESTPSPARLSEGEETGPVEIRPVECFESEERAVNGYLHGGSPGLLTKKTKLLVKEEIGDGARRLGRSGRQLSFLRGSSSPLVEKIDPPAAPKPVRNTKSGSDRNGRNSGRPPLKKYSERRGFTRLGLVPNGTAPNGTGESDDDREDLLAAAKFTCNANYQACSSSFWKKMEPLFSITAEDKSYLMQQLKLLEEVSHGLEPNKSEAPVKQGRDSDLFCDRDFGEEHSNMSTSLYQRLLSALVVEDELEDFEQENLGENPLFFSASEAYSPVEEAMLCNGDTHSIEIPYQAGLLQEDYSSMQSEAGVLPAGSNGNLNGSLASQINISGDSSQGHYAQMSLDEKLQVELQSIGLHAKTVPDNDEGEDEIFSGEILLLKRQLHQEANKKKLRLERIWKAVAVEMELKQWELEQVAVSRLVVLAYRKLLATRGRINKVSRQAAIAFVKRTLARCRRFEATGKSCFSEPALWDVICAGPPSSANNGSSSAGAVQPGLRDSRPERVLFDPHDPSPHQPAHPYTKNGPILNRGKKKEVLLDDVGNSGAAFKLSPHANNAPNGGAKGKRSERDRDKDSLAKSKSKVKSKPKQRANQSSTHPVGPFSMRKQESSKIPDSSKQGERPADLVNLPVHELDPMELGVESELEGHQDLSSWLNFDDDVLHDHDDTMGLEIPMDDLSDLNMLL